MIFFIWDQFCLKIQCILKLLSFGNFFHKRISAFRIMHENCSFWLIFTKNSQYSPKWVIFMHNSEYTNGCMKKITKTQKFQNTLNFRKKLVLYQKNHFWLFEGQKRQISWFWAIFMVFCKIFKKNENLRCH